MSDWVKTMQLRRCAAWLIDMEEIKQAWIGNCK